MFMNTTCKFMFVFFFFYKEPNNSFDLPPSPPSLPIVGHLHLIISSSMHKCFQKISSKYGHFLHLRIFHVPIVLVSSPTVAYEIFKAHDTNVSYRGPIAIDECIVFGSSGYIRAPSGDYWRFMKKIIMAKALGPQALERTRGVRLVELERFHRNLLDKAMNLAYFELLGDAGLLNQEPAKYLQVTAQQIQKQAQKLFRKENSSTMVYLAEGSPEDGKTA